MVSALVASRFSMWMLWGPEMTFFCNDAYRRDTLGKKYPWALGRPSSEVWAEIWPDIGPRIATVLATGESTWDEALLLMVERNGYEEESYHTFSYSPLTDDSGAIAGMLCVVSEETDRVIGDRRMATLRDIGSVSTANRDERAFLVEVTAQLENNLRSIPFSAVYLFAPNGDAVLTATTGFSDADPAAPARIPVGDLDAVWPVARLATGEVKEVVVDDLDARFNGLPAGPWPAPPSHAVLTALQDPGGALPFGFLIAGANRFRPVDADFHSFTGLIAQRMSVGVASARAYAAERDRAEQLAALDRAKTAFLSNVSHELRTPLTLMLGPLQDALEGTSNMGLEDVELAHRNGLRLLKLVNGLLDFSRLEAGRLRAGFRPVDIAGLTGELVGTFRDACRRGGLELTVTAHELAGEVYVDPNLWERIVLNLMSNAFKFTLTGGITVETGSVEGAFFVSVSDTGPGIPPHELTRVFERFHRVKTEEARSQEGSGIGLALVKELVELHGGEITVDSVLGQGSRFTVTLPLGSQHLPADQVSSEPTIAVAGISDLFAEEALSWVPGDAESVVLDASEVGDDAALAPTPAVAPGAGARSRVLIADDNPDLRQYLSRLFLPFWDVETVSNGSDALVRVQESPPDLLVTDVMMPGLDGFELLAAVRLAPETRELPVIMLSARAGEEASIEGLGAGADDYLPKPFSGRELLARARAHLQLSRVRSQASAEIAAERQRLEQTLRQLPAGVILADAESGRVVMANAEVEQMLTSSVLGATLENPLIHPSFDRDHAPLSAERAPLARAVRLGEVVVDEQLLHRAPDGREMTLLANAAPIYDGDGNIVAGVVVFQDITSRVRTERLLASQSEIQAMIARGVPLRESLEAITTATQRLSDRGGRASILLVSSDGEHLESGVAPDLPAAYNREIDGLEIGPMMGSCGTAAYRGETVIVTDIDDDPLWAPFRELAASHGLRACWSTPIFATDGELVGTFAVYHSEPVTPTSEEDRIIELLSRTAALAIERDRDARAREREVSARMRQLNELQSSLLPPELPSTPGLQVAVAFHPGDRTLEVGGDFYDVFALGEDTWGVVIGDVMGHGALAAAVTALTRHTTRAVARLTGDPAVVLTDVSEALRKSGYQRFCTAVYGCLERSGNGFDVRLAVGGHPPPIIRRADGTIETLSEHGPLLGVMPNPAFPTLTGRLEAGETLVLYTDGLVERNPRIRDDGELGRLIGSLPDGDAQVQLAELEATALGSRAVEKTDDDIAVLMVRATHGESADGGVEATARLVAS